MTLDMAADAQLSPGLVSPMEIYGDYISKSSGWTWVIVEKADTCVRNKPIIMSCVQHFSTVPNKQCCHADRVAAVPGRKTELNQLHLWQKLAKGQNLSRSI